MSEEISLSALELELLKLAVPYAKETKESEGKYPSRDDLRRKLECSSDSAQRLLKFITQSDAGKIAARLEALPVRAEDKATVQYALGDTSGSLASHVLRENARLTKRLAKKEHIRSAEKEQREQEIKDEIEALKALAKTEISTIRKPKKTKKSTNTGLLLEIAAPDLHVGKLAHPLETGGRPYDVKIAIATFERALDALIQRTSHYSIEEVLFVVGNDLFNSDNPENTTTGGTAVTTDGRFYKTFWKTRTMMVSAVEKLRHIAKVRILICPGNHDRQTAYHLGDSLECYFHNDPMVVVENLPSSRKYVEWGKSLIGFCHGDEGKHSDYALLMAAENPEAWGRTKFREMHTGHYHRMQTEEFHGVRVRILSALCPPDDWHSAQGYIGAIRQAEAFVWSKTEGVIAEVFYNDDAQEALVTKREIV